MSRQLRIDASSLYRSLELDRRCALGQEPLREAVDPRFKQAEIVCSTLDADWRQRLVDRWWSVDYNGRLGPEQKELLLLRDRLLAFAGSAVCLPDLDEDLERIMVRGQLWLGNQAQLKRGRVSQCHRNSALLWEARQGLPNSHTHLATGYALSSDGMWRQHSWCLWERSRSVKVLETTETRVAYYGFALLPNEAHDFLWRNG